ncbi:MAG: ATP-dependent sacrificial sulfur transferase LarE [Candidatus Hydrogenedentes bacterium]|nr:ATP-dependent sacrificial sulfur transferase LarE [Candidatus Hydrogenedentota bacterium]
MSPSVKSAGIPAFVLAKEQALFARLQTFPALAVAYSGGVDSTYLAAVAHDALGGALTLILADSPSIPRSEVREAIALAEERGWPLQIVQTTEFDKEAFLANDGTRCYHCKTELFTQMDAIAKTHGIPVIAYGEIADDRHDPTRLGAKAAAEHQVIAPLADAGLSKEEIRRLAKARGLANWNKASFACLSSRFPKGTPVNIEEMHRVEAGEEFLKAHGFHQYRVRHHGDLCRIEVEPRDFPKFLDPAFHEALLANFREIGYKHITLDLAGYRTGSTATG